MLLGRRPPYGAMLLGVSSGDGAGGVCKADSMGETATYADATRSFWGWGRHEDLPTDADRAALAARLAERHGVEISAPPIPSIDDVELRPARLDVPDTLAGWCSTAKWDRAEHTYGMAFPDRYRAFHRQFDHPPDVVAFPSSEDELEPRCWTGAAARARSSSPTAAVRRWWRASPARRSSSPW